MATRRIGGAVQDADYREIDGSSEDISELDDSQEGELRGVLNELNADPDAQEVYIKVFKWVEGYKKPYDCFQANVSDMDGLSDRIRKEYGSGKYRVNVIRNGKLFKVIDYPILAPMNSQPEKQTNPGGDMAVFMQQTREMFNQQFSMMKELFMQKTGTAAAPTDPTTMMAAMMGVMVKMKEFVQPQPSNNSFDNFLQMFDVVERISSSKGDSSFVDVIRDGIKTLGPAISNATTKIGQATQSPVVHAGVTQQTQVEQSQQTNADQNQQTQGMNEMQQQQMVLGYINRLVYKAKTNSDPGLQADNVIDDIPAEIIKEHLLNQDTIDKLSMVNSEVANHRQWFEQLQAHLMDTAIELQWVQERPAWVAETANKDG